MNLPNRNVVAERDGFALKPGCEEDEEQLLQGFPMKEGILLNINLPCAKQHKLSQLNN